LGLPALTAFSRLASEPCRSAPAPRAGCRRRGSSRSSLRSGLGPVGGLAGSAAAGASVETGSRSPWRPAWPCRRSRRGPRSRSLLAEGPAGQHLEGPAQAAVVVELDPPAVLGLLGLPSFASWKSFTTSWPRRRSWPGRTSPPSPG
jgi:hypothetical protein